MKRLKFVRKLNNETSFMENLNVVTKYKISRSVF